MTLATAEITNWYTITKDIIIPLLSVLATIILGTIIAISLKNKEEKAKIKNLLIDNYMLYLNKKINFLDHEINNFNYQILKDIHNNYEHYFEPHANLHITREIINTRLNKLKEVIDTVNRDEINWSPFTFKFCFLLGKKKYNKDAQTLENVITANYKLEGPRKNLGAELKTQVVSNKNISESIGVLNKSSIEDALSSIELLTAVYYNEFQLKVFTPYDNKIADLIDSY